MSLVCKFIPGNETNNSLYKAIYSGDLDKLNHIIDSFGLSHCPSWAEGYDLLLTAIECKHVDMAKLLVHKGCKTEGTQAGQSRSVLHLAVRQGDTELISMLIDRESGSLTKTEEGDSPLLVAVAEGREDVVRLLLERGADVESRSGGGLTPLHLAAVRGHVEVLEQLLMSGADIESEDGNGKTALFLTVSSGNKKILKILLNSGANCQCKSKNGQTPLLDATGKGYSDIVQDLLAFGADFNDKNSFGQTPLHIACMQKNKTLISILLNAGADVNATDSTGMVPCDSIVKKVSPCSIYFENSSVSYLLGKHFTVLKMGGFYLNRKNQSFYDMFFNMYCNEIIVGNVVLSSTSYVLRSIKKNCEDELFMMKTTKSDSGFTVYDIFKKLKNPLSVTTENEIMFLKSIDLKEKFPLYTVFIENLLKKAKLRNELLTSGQEWFSFLIQQSENKITALPEEMGIHIVSYLSNNELKHLMQCGEEIHRHKN